MSSSDSPSNKRIRKHFATAYGTPRCGRQLSRPASTTANQQSMMLTADPGEVGCRHCLRAMRLLAPVARRLPDDDESEAEREVDRLLYEQELEEEKEEA